MYLTLRFKFIFSTVARVNFSDHPTHTVKSIPEEGLVAELGLFHITTWDFLVPVDLV